MHKCPTLRIDLSDTTLADTSPAMRRPLILALLLIALGSAFAAWWLQPEKIIARRFAKLCASATVTPDSSSLTRSTRGMAIEDFLAPTLTLLGPESSDPEFYGTQSRDTITSLYSYLAKESRRISLEKPTIHEINVTQNHARATASVDAILELPDGRRPSDGIQHLTMTWRKIEKHWRLETLRWHEEARPAPF
ncbi:MAG: hypothetical protein EAZ84_13575 [Verrucomicrobia bacterium]|nr:MAG: hypothetical protein EAZ84_13575 [Verrucomicrobiota bacterium]TAE86450.1 MAG: hypothetical protein EAZ82_11200 [Verrucomicrobiota bacterium]TAF23951.1 MAG: hypothetical protein EAZ71_11825 [Verrucomicrobiota bacterium]